MASLSFDARRSLAAARAISKVSSAGVSSSYQALAMESDSKVIDVICYDDRTKPAKAFVAIQSNESDDGQASKELISKVANYLNNEDRKPLGVQIIVSSITPIKYSINAEVTLEPNVDAKTVLASMNKAIKNLTKAKQKIGSQIALSEVYASLNIEGVAVVESLKSPTQNIKSSKTQVPFCTGINIKELHNA